MRWSGAAQAAVYIQAGEAVDLSRETNGEMVLAVDLMVEDFLDRRQRGDKPTIEEYCLRHPELEDEIVAAKVERAHRELLAAVDGSPTLRALGRDCIRERVKVHVNITNPFDPAFGADVKMTQWNIDGVNRTLPEGGTLYWSMNDEMVAEIQVLGTGATAEYGGMLGTAFNVVTKSGTNAVHEPVHRPWPNQRRVAASRPAATRSTAAASSR